jgi:arsenate reductase
MGEIVADAGRWDHPGMSKPITVYGIANCDSVKKARIWLDQRQIDYRFHDFKKLGLPADRLAAWIAEAGWEVLLNRQGSTWRKLDAAVQASITGAAAAGALMQAQPSIVKRPVVEWKDRITVGFDPARWEQIANAGV